MPGLISSPGCTKDASRQEEACADSFPEVVEITNGGEVVTIRLDANATTLALGGEGSNALISGVDAGNRPLSNSTP